jgi:hypothetical protein
MKTTKKRIRKYVFINGLRYIKQSNCLVLDQIVRNTIDQFHNYSNLQTI